jgi:glutaredoxin
MNEIRMALSKDKTIQFPFDYSTRPMVFINGRFIGGYSELAEQF